MHFNGIGEIMAGQYLTKSRFKIGVECPSKLFYLDDKSYGNLNEDNSFLESLAEGGFQVGVTVSHRLETL